MTTNPDDAETIRRLTATVVLGLAAAAAVLLTPGASAAAGGSGQHKDLAAARQATARFHDVQAAQAAGYEADPYCTSSPAGAMGHHYFRGSNVGSTDPRSPAVLLYLPDRKGGLRLGGVEYVVPDADQDLSTDDDRPAMFGTAFQGPMPGHFEGMPVHYDLHVWVWQHNPAGMFSEWNSAHSCP